MVKDNIYKGIFYVTYNQFIGNLFGYIAFVHFFLSGYAFES